MAPGQDGCQGFLSRTEYFYTLSLLSVFLHEAKIAVLKCLFIVTIPVFSQ